MPPVSVTMHALNLPAADAPPDELVLADLLFAVEPHAAASSASTLSAAAARTVCLTVFSFSWAACAARTRRRPPSLRSGRPGHQDPKRPTLGCPKADRKSTRLN